MTKWFHAIGVSGKVTANIAKMFNEKGWFVTGSDSQFFPPASDILKDNNINIVEGFNYLHLTKTFWEEKLGTALDTNENPDLVLFISHLTDKNKEYLFAKVRGLDVRPFARILKEYLIKPESIVAAGTAGKTTTTSLLTCILKDLGLDPSYMIGADVKDLQESLYTSDSQWSVIEGDEYHNPSPEIEGKAKFLEYKPKYVVLTNIGWEHQDIFPSQERYNEEFRKLVELVPAEGIIAAHAGDKNIDEVIKSAKCKVIRYKLSDVSNQQSVDGVWKVVKESDVHKIYDSEGNFVMEFKTSLIGDYNLENILAAVALVTSIPSITELKGDLGSVKSSIIKTIENFKGPKKRLEILHKSEELIVIDDFGIAPDRARNSLKTIRENFKDYENLIAVFEPNSGSRPMDLQLFNKMYEGAFNDASEVIIPDLSASDPSLVDSEELTSRLLNLGFNSEYISADNLKSALDSKVSNKKSIVVFFSSYRLTKIAESFAENK